MKTPVRFILVFTSILALYGTPEQINAQQPEVGIRVVVSGAILFGPYFTYWIDDHHELNTSVLAAYVGEFIIPFAVNAGYTAHFLNTRFRPELGLQYTYLISPRRHKAPEDPNGMSILAFMPGAEFRWNNNTQNVQGKFWLAHIFSDRNKGKFRPMPIGLDLSYGIKIQ